MFDVLLIACTGLPENETLTPPSVDKFKCYDNGDNWSIFISVIFRDGTI